MIIGTVEGVEQILGAGAPPGVTVVSRRSAGELLDEFATAGVDWILWSRRPRLETAVQCKVICAARPVAASCVAHGEGTVSVMDAGWCVQKTLGRAEQIELPVARDVWLRTWTRLLAHSSERGGDGGEFVCPLLTLALDGASPETLRESTDLPERTFRYRLARCRSRGSRRIVMVSATLLAWEWMRAGGSCEQAAYRAGYETLSAFDRMLKRLVGVTARDLAALPEAELAVRLQAGLWREEKVAGSG